MARIWATIKIWRETHPKLRMLAAIENITIGELIDRLAQNELDRRNAQTGQQRGDSTSRAEAEAKGI